MDGNIAERYKYDAFGRRSLIETANDTGSFDILAIVNDGSDRTIDITQGGDGTVAPIRRYITSNTSFDVDTGNLIEKRRADAFIKKDKVSIDLEIKGGKNARLKSSQKRKLGCGDNLTFGIPISSEP